MRVLRPRLVELSADYAVIDAAQSVRLTSARTQQVAEYRFYLTSQHGASSPAYSGGLPRAKLGSLEPYTDYKVALEACTFLSDNASSAGGCLLSEDLFAFRTNQSKPSGLEAITCVDLPFNELYVSVWLVWQAPRRLNGRLKLVQLKRDASLIFDSNETTTHNNNNNNTSATTAATSFFDQGLVYGQTYVYELAYYNDAGMVSVQVEHTTTESLPRSVDRVRCVAALSATAISVEWSKPLYPNGRIVAVKLRYARQDDIKNGNNNNSSWHEIELKVSNSKRIYFNI